jgi:hypothetical protein
MTDEAPANQVIELRPAGPIHLSANALALVLGEEITKLTICVVPELDPTLKGHSAWLGSFARSTTFIARFHEHGLMLRIIRAVDGALEDYVDARAALLEFVVTRAPRLYFRSLRRFEGVLGQLWPALDLTQKRLRQPGDPRHFETGDGSVFERMHIIHTAGKHHPPLAPDSRFPAVWLENDGIHSAGASLGFDELADLLSDVGELAERIATHRPP